MIRAKKAGLGLKNPMTSVESRFLSSRRARTELIWDVIGERIFSTANHLLELRVEICDRQKIRDAAKGTKIGGLVENLKSPGRRLILHAKHTSSWMAI